MNTLRKSIRIVNRQGNALRGDLRYSHSATPLPLVIVCHSFMAFKDWGFFPHTGEKIAENGFACLTFNFSLDGADEDEPRITRFEDFARNTFTAELQDCRDLLDAVGTSEEFRGIVDPGRIGFLGHSRGGAIALLTAVREKRVRSLVTWASVSRLDRWTQRQKTAWRKDGYLPLARDSSVSPLRLGIGLLNDLEGHAADYNLRKAASGLHIPWLIIHGSEDVTVPVREGEQLYAASDPRTTQFDVIGHAGHLFDAATPETDGYRTIDGVIDRTIQWFNTTLENSWNEQRYFRQASPEQGLTGAR